MAQGMLNLRRHGTVTPNPPAEPSPKKIGAPPPPPHEAHPPVDALEVAWTALVHAVDDVVRAAAAEAKREADGGGKDGDEEDESEAAAPPPAKRPRRGKGAISHISRATKRKAKPKPAAANNQAKDAFFGAGTLEDAKKALGAKYAAFDAACDTVYAMFEARAAAGESAAGGPGGGGGDDAFAALRARRTQMQTFVADFLAAGID